MKIILVDAWNTFVTEDWVNIELQKLLDSFPNRKIILTNANEEEKVKLGIVNMPYEVFSLEHNPNKHDWGYYEKMLNTLWLDTYDLVYFEHNNDAVWKARDLWINTYLYNFEKKDLLGLESFLNDNL